MPFNKEDFVTLIKTGKVKEAKEMLIDTDSHLDLSGSNIFTFHIPTLIEVLSDNTTITSLDISGSKIDGQGALLLRKMLEDNNHTIIFIDLKGTAADPGLINDILRPRQIAANVGRTYDPSRPSSVVTIPPLTENELKALEDITKKIVDSAAAKEEGGINLGLKCDLQTCLDTEIKSNPAFGHILLRSSKDRQTDIAESLRDKIGNGGLSFNKIKYSEGDQKTIEGAVKKLYSELTAPLTQSKVAGDIMTRG